MRKSNEEMDWNERLYNLRVEYQTEIDEEILIDVLREYQDGSDAELIHVGKRDLHGEITVYFKDIPICRIEMLGRIIAHQSNKRWQRIQMQQRIEVWKKWSAGK